MEAIVNKALSFIAVCVTTALCAGLPAAASAATFSVNTFGGDSDTNTADDLCDFDAGTAGQQCTLVAAIEQSNATGGADVINFDRSGAGLGPTPTISIGADLPAITQAVTIAAGNCGTASAPEPCVGLSGAVAADGLVANANGVSISGLAITGYNGGPAIASSTGTTGLVVRNTWLGLDLAGGESGNGVGVLLEGSSSKIGGPLAANRNVFANSTEAGLRIFKGDDNEIRGNYFGTDETGNPGANGNTENIVVEGDLTGSEAGTPDGNVIGGRVTGAALGTPDCDGVCNLVVNASGGFGIDLGGLEGVTLAAGATEIAGNHVGISLGGTVANPNAFSGINLGNAHDVVVGGPDPRDRNYIGGNGTAGLIAGDGVTAQNNFFGLNTAGDTAIPDVVAAAALNGDLANPVTFTDNRVAGDGTGSGLTLESSNGVANANTFGIGTGGEAFGLNPAISIAGSGNTIGAPGAGNVIGNSFDPDTDEASAITIQQGDDNTLQANMIGVDAANADIGNEGHGIFIQFGSDGNQIGGPTTATQNLISNNGGDAISATGGGTEPQGNVFERNRGTGNGDTASDLFIDIGNDGQGNFTSVHGGVEVPQITAATTDAVGGTAQGNAVVRVFKKASASPGELATLVGTTTANGIGNWRLACPSAECVSAPLLGQRITASQTPAGGSSELTPFVIANDGELEVDTIADDGDANPADGECYTFSGECSLRAAIEQANGTSGAQDITFDHGELGPDPTIGLTAGTLAVNGPGKIRGCSTGINGPCVGLRNGDAVGTGMTVGAANVTISGLALSGFVIKGIAADAAADNFKVRDSWFGLRLDETEENNGTGIEVLGDDADIGGTTASLRNVFASNNAGVSLLGADRASIRGNFFGTLPNGSTAASNQSAILVRKNISPLDPALDNLIGDTVTGAAASSPACDGACNLITGGGVDLGSDPATSPLRTAVRGNFVGLNRLGTATLGVGVGVNVGAARRTTIGGPALGDRNYVAGSGDDAIRAADGVTVENNFVGLNSAGTAALGGFGLNLAGDADEPVIVRDNRIVGSGCSGASLFGSDGVVTGNVFGATVDDTRVPSGCEAITLTGSGYQIGGDSPDEANVIAGSSSGSELGINGFGDPSRGDNNVVTGNFIGTNALGADLSVGVNGIAMSNGADDNVIGGDGNPTNNVISHVIAPISINSSSRNTVKRNRGLGNGGSNFIVLAAGNDNIATPTPDVPTSTSLTGFGGVPNATIRAFLTFDESPASIRRFLAQTTADGSGNFTLNYASLPAGACIALSQTDASGNSSSLSSPVSVGGGACDTTGPTTTFDSGPTIGNPTTDTTPTFTFHASEPNSTFQCRIDTAAFAQCNGPIGSHTPPSPLAVGDHVIRVRATDPLGNPGPVASRNFRINSP
jgi:hypothetical protein